MIDINNRYKKTHEIEKITQILSYTLFKKNRLEK